MPQAFSSIAPALRIVCCLGAARTRGVRNSAVREVLREASHSALPFLEDKAHEVLSSGWKRDPILQQECWRSLESASFREADFDHNALDHLLEWGAQDTRLALWVIAQFDGTRAPPQALLG